MDSTGPVRDQGDLAEMVELLLEKGVVVNADVVVSVGDTELLGVELRAAIASFETAAKYGLEFPDGTDRERVIEAANTASGEIRGRDDGEVTDDASDATSTQERSLRMRPGGPAGSGDGGGDTANPASSHDKGASEAHRRTPAGAGDVTIDPAPYDPTRADLDPDVEDPGADHPEVEQAGDETDTAEPDTTDTDDADATDDTNTDDTSDSPDTDASTEPDEDGEGGDGE